MVATGRRVRAGRFGVGAALIVITLSWLSPRARADGMLVAPKDYAGSLEEKAQEAILIFQPGDATHKATEDLILKIRVQGEVAQFAWVIPLPNEPATAREDAALFTELHNYVQ